MRRALAAVLLGAATAALTPLPPISADLPPVVNPGSGFEGDDASGWFFADGAFVDGLPRAADPDVPSLAGFDDPAFDGLLAVGGSDTVLAAERPLTLAERIRDGAPPVPRYDAVALGVFDASNAQSLADHSITIGGVTTSGGKTTFRFAGQVGADDSD